MPEQSLKKTYHHTSQIKCHEPTKVDGRGSLESGRRSTVTEQHGSKNLDRMTELPLMPRTTSWPTPSQHVMSDHFWDSFMSYLPLLILEPKTSKGHLVVWLNKRPTNTPTLQDRNELTWAQSFQHAASSIFFPRRG